MIEVTINLETDTVKRPLAKIRIKNDDWHFSDESATEASYRAEFSLQDGDDFKLFSRKIYGFERKKYNALALLRAVLETLEEEELKLNGETDSGHMAWRQHGTLPEIQAGES